MEILVAPIISPRSCDECPENYPSCGTEMCGSDVDVCVYTETGDPCVIRIG